MGRIFILVTGLSIFGITSKCFTQNLVRNPDFENIIPNNGDFRIYKNHFYAKDWFQTTDCTVDIYRDNKVCNDSFIMNMEPQLDFCVDVVSGNYCIGFIPIDYFGYMEHITGTLIDTLKAGKTYKVSFHIRYFNETSISASKGFGYKFGKDSTIFKTNIILEKKMSPFYYDLFQKNKVFPDFAMNEYFIDTVWNKITSYYVANGGEKFITFGRFSYLNDGKIIKQFKNISREPYIEKILKFINSNKSLVVKSFAKNIENPVGKYLYNYYLFDRIEVVHVGDSERDSVFYSQYATCVDLDTTTSHCPSKREFIVDKGFFGDMEIELGIRLKPLEKLVIEYGRNSSIIIVNTNSNDPEKYAETKYYFKYPAKKLRKKSILFYVEKTGLDELKFLDKNFNKSLFLNTSFEGLIYSNK